MKICPKCGSLTNFNTYFGAEICSNSQCDWKDDSFNQIRLRKLEEFRNLFFLLDKTEENETFEKSGEEKLVLP